MVMTGKPYMWLPTLLCLQLGWVQSSNRNYACIVSSNLLWCNWFDPKHMHEVPTSWNWRGRHRSKFTTNLTFMWLQEKGKLRFFTWLVQLLLQFLFQLTTLDTPAQPKKKCKRKKERKFLIMPWGHNKGLF